MARRNTKKASEELAVHSDIYQRITDRIVGQLEEGTRPWFKPWKGGAPCRPLRHNGQPYRGINVVLLWIEAEDRGYTSPYWMTYKQAQELGGQVKKGEKSALVVYANTFEKKEEDPETGEERERRIPFMKGYSVFNADQIEGLPEQFHIAAQPEQPENEFDRIEAADRFFENLGADIRTGGSRAFYSSSGDFIRMPPFENFVSAEAHAATLGHECVHWTMHETRLDRDFGTKQRGDAGYAREELVAELGSVFLCADLGIEAEPRDDHAAYIGSWLKALKNDKRAIFQAASHAEKAVGYLHSKQPKAEEAAENEGVSVAA
ncbi:zincin-like metallopeptidase domain-containing protein [Martelella sp. HB161492]|uniref:ArdC family protein n=1 Tax=Martelella sp. HB161492 TaxID=2720726 RepID=UPI00158FDC34|nr:zincin-like metallopeptidase domain-containing protein [Martelella sp. HB161492]